MAARKFSARRRQLVIAAAAGATTPAWAALCGTEGRGRADALCTVRRGESLVVSGRVVDARARPVAGASIDALGQRFATTDGDGRFVFTTTASADLRHLDCRVVSEHRSPGISALDLRAATRDERGVWRATCSLTLA